MQTCPNRRSKLGYGHHWRSTRASSAWGATQPRTRMWLTEVWPSREPTLTETIAVSNSDVGYLSQSDVSCETIYLPPLSLPPETCLGLFLLFIPFRVFANSSSLFSLIKNAYNMGLTNNPNECIEEVDVIIAGGTSHLLYYLYMKTTELIKTNSRRYCGVCSRWKTGRSGSRTVHPRHRGRTGQFQRAQCGQPAPLLPASATHQQDSPVL